MSHITSLFKSYDPLIDLKRHMDIVHRCAHQLIPLFDHLLAGDEAGTKEVAKLIFAAEHEADTLKHEIRSHLPRSLWLAINRSDLLEVLHHQDGIADRAEDIAGLLLLREWQVPENLREDLPAFVRETVAVVDRTHALVHRLDDLVATRFAGRVVEEVESAINAISKAESGCDKRERHLARSLFAAELDLNPVSVVLWYRVLEWLGDVADHAERTANKIRLTVAH